MKLWDFVPEFTAALIEHLKEDDKRWGDAYIKRKRLGQDDRFITRTNDRLDQYTEADVPIDYLAIAGDALICWARQQHEDIWPE